jgi:uncharacterized membrane protein
MIRLPSVRALTLGLQQVVRRFPLVVLVAALKAVTLITLVEVSRHESPYEPLLIRLALIFFLALPLVLSLHLVAERREWSSTTLGLALLGIIGMLLVYYLSLETTPIQRDYYRFGMFMACAHLLVSFAPFVGYNEPMGFWQFNKTMLLQLLTATLYAGTMYIGLIIAIETVRFLFDIAYPFQIELDLFLLIGGFFHTLFFLNGFPAQLYTLEARTTYSHGVKIFTQYVLLPLVVVYLLILYVYTAKILIQWRLPEGGVAYLVMAFSVAGVLALLLLYPIRDSAEERWIRIFSRRFHLALFPLIILLFASIYRRIQDYGITENRYLVAALAIWLAGISIYILLSKKDDIRWIPLSLCIISFLLAVGPWSIFSVSRRDQAQRFGAILQQYQLLNTPRENMVSLPEQDYNRLISGIRYFRDRRESGVLRPYFKPLPTEADHFALASAMENQLEAATNVNASPVRALTSLTYELSETNFELDTRGFDKAWFFELNQKTQPESGAWRIEAANGNAVVTIFKNDEKIVAWDMAPRLAELEARYGPSHYQLSPSQLTFSHPRAKLILRSISRNGTTYSYQGVLLKKE